MELIKIQKEHPCYILNSLLCVCVCVCCRTYIKKLHDSQRWNCWFNRNINIVTALSVSWRWYTTLFLIQCVCCVCLSGFIVYVNSWMHFFFCWFSIRIQFDFGLIQLLKLLFSLLYIWRMPILMNVTFVCCYRSWKYMHLLYNRRKRRRKSFRKKDMTW